DNDHIVPVANGHILHFFLKRSRLKVIKGAGHLFLLSRRDETIDIIRDFFGEPHVDMPHLDPVQLPSVTAAYMHS
ncbi:MAG: alpha/beta hydrolase, partial [Robiginitomaculum sp.]